MSICYVQFVVALTLYYRELYSSKSLLNEKKHDSRKWEKLLFSRDIKKEKISLITFSAYSRNLLYWTIAFQI